MDSLRVRMRIVGAYVPLFFAVIVATGAMLAPFAIDAHHWWPRKRAK
jgi:hypothetical protein